jgi:hypothetical protein
METTPTSRPHAALACPECEAPLEQSQRYCVSCGTRNAGADDPAARWFAGAARRRSAAPRARRRGIDIGSAAVLAVLPLAVAFGVLVGRANHGDDALLHALRAQKTTVVNVGGGGTADAGAATSTTGATPAKVTKAALAASEEVTASGVGGVAHSVLHHVSTPAERARDKQVVQRITKQVGTNYIDAQRNLPDVIEVPSGGGGEATPPQGAGQP